MRETTRRQIALALRVTRSPTWKPPASSRSSDRRAGVARGLPLRHQAEWQGYLRLAVAALSSGGPVPTMPPRSTLTCYLSSTTSRCHRG
ncbi:hypothetical protein DSL92_03350 [Billgrantia gudaonensis]|uniref:Uncharacterized protein n=1 Tax=Billgrantia gudaonensis TaxID=376427 RepID=A0A432JL12_9GAMM|nr:hypothetical protein DSL92_03350 [Halomonas gudaonensis]